MFQNRPSAQLALNPEEQQARPRNQLPTADDFADDAELGAGQLNAVGMPVGGTGGGWWDTIKEWGQPMIGGALSGMATGGATGSVVPGLGTLIGMGVGGIAGAGGGLLGHLADKKYEEAHGETLSSMMAPEGFNNFTGGALPMLGGALAGPLAVGAMALMGAGKSGDKGGTTTPIASTPTASTPTVSTPTASTPTASTPTPAPRNDTWVGGNSRPRGGDLWTQRALPPMGGMPTNVPSTPMPSIPEGVMKGFDTVNTAAGMLPNLPGGNALGALNSGAHIFNEGLTQENVIGGISSGLNFVPQLAPFNAARGIWDGVATFSGHEGLTSTSLANGFVNSAVNGAASMTAEEMAMISTYQ